MKKTNIFVVVLSFLTLLLQACNRHIPAPAEIKIIPKPLELTKRQGVFKLNKKTAFYLADTVSALQTAAGIFAGYINPSSSFVLKPVYRKDTQAVKDAIVVILDGDKSRFGKEGYSLEIAPDKVLIRAAAPAGKPGCLSMR